MRPITVKHSKRPTKATRSPAIRRGVKQEILPEQNAPRPSVARSMNDWDAHLAEGSEDIQAAGMDGDHEEAILGPRAVSIAWTNLVRYDAP